MGYDTCHHTVLAELIENAATRQALKLAAGYLAQGEAPWESRALPGRPEEREYHRFEVIRSFESESSYVTPWFGQRGLGKQFRLDKEKFEKGVDTLVDEGFVRER